MSRHNYRNDFVKKNVDEIETTAIVADEETVVVHSVEEPVKKTVTGKVVDCARLNVRKNPSATASILCTLDRSTEVIIDEDNSTDEYYKVCAANGVEGYCVKNFVTISFSTK